MDAESRSQVSGSQVTSWKRNAAAGGIVGLVAIVVFFALGSVAWPVGMLGLLLPGIYFAGQVAFTWGGWIGEYRWTLLIASLVVNVVVFSASWALLRRSGRLAGVGKLMVVAAWLSYFGLLVWGFSDD